MVRVVASVVMKMRNDEPSDSQTSLKPVVAWAVALLPFEKAKRRKAISCYYEFSTAAD
jgi:hypothetical protein